MLACIAVLGVFTALLWPLSLGPDLDPLAVIECRERLAGAVSAIERGLKREADISLSLDQDALAVLVADLVAKADVSGIRLRMRDETAYLGFRISGPYGTTAHAQLVIQPSLLDGHIFLGLRQVRVGLLSLPPGWFVGMQQEAGGGSWQVSRGQPGYVLPGGFRHEGVLLEVTDLWLTNGWVEVTLRPVVSPK